MVKLVALILISGTVFSSFFLTLTDAHENGGNSNRFSTDAEIASGNQFARDKFPKKYHKEKEKKNYYPVKESHYDRDDRFESKETGKKFPNENELREFHKSEKHGKYDRRGNHHEDFSGSKSVNYHDKVGIHEREKSNKEGKNEPELVGDEMLVSLHHDIDVNYLHHPKKSPPDAELINLEEIGKSHKKKESYKNLSGNDKKVRASFYKNMKEIDFTTSPNRNNSAMVARYIIHKVDWTALGTLSTNVKLKGSPFVNVISVSDGPEKKGSGVPFFYMTPKDFSSLDLEKDNRSCMTVTLAQTGYCDNRFDPEDPLCARLILCGKIKKIKSGSEEEDFARLALFSRHPEMQKWPADHDWFFSKLKIKQIILINHFGGASYISLQDYFNPDSV